MKKTSPLNFKFSYYLTVYKFIWFAVILSVTASCSRPKNIQDAILHDRHSYYYLNTAEYSKDRSNLPVGIFDSGTGGLSVLNDLLEYRTRTPAICMIADSAMKDQGLRNESFIFLADMANMPYGSYALEKNTPLLIEHIFKDVHFLLGKRYYQDGRSARFKEDKSPVKAIVIACNTATAYGLDTIRDFLREAKLDIDVLGVIDGGALGALRSFDPGEKGSIAVFATDGTVRSGAYLRTIEEHKKKLGFTGKISIFQQAGIGIAESIDENIDFIDRSAKKPRRNYKGPSSETEGDLKIDISLLDRYNFDVEGSAMLYEGDKTRPGDLQINSVRNYIAFHIVTLLEKIKGSAEPLPLEVAVLGCTHYPFYENTFREIFADLRDYEENGIPVYRDYIAEDLEIINPADIVAGQLYELLEKKNLLNRSEASGGEFYISIPNVMNKNIKTREDGSFTYEYKYGRKAGEIQEYVRYVPFSRTSVAPDVLERLSEQIPTVFNLITSFNNHNPKTAFLPEEEKIIAR